MSVFFFVFFWALLRVSYNLSSRKVFSKRDIVNALIQEGFSKDVAQVYSEFQMLIHDTPIVVRFLHEKRCCCYCNLCENLHSH
jgi:hypothetical protein